jgi:hypothetical protein
MTEPHALQRLPLYGTRDIITHNAISNGILDVMADYTDFLPGDGPTSGISVTLTTGTLQAIRERVGKRGVSAYLEKAAQRQIERDNLDELIADFDKVHGPADPEAVAAKRARLTGGPSDAGVTA